jgi:hypothetical protein
VGNNEILWATKGHEDGGVLWEKWTVEEMNYGRELN